MQRPVQWSCDSLDHQGPPLKDKRIGEPSALSKTESSQTAFAIVWQGVAGDHLHRSAALMGTELSTSCMSLSVVLIVEGSTHVQQPRVVIRLQWCGAERAVHMSCRQARTSPTPLAHLLRTLAYWLQRASQPQPSPGISRRKLLAFLHKCYVSALSERCIISQRLQILMTGSFTQLKLVGMKKVVRMPPILCPKRRRDCVAMSRGEA